MVWLGCCCIVENPGTAQPVELETVPPPFCHSVERAFASLPDSSLCIEGAKEQQDILGQPNWLEELEEEERPEGPWVLPRELGQAVPLAALESQEPEVPARDGGPQQAVPLAALESQEPEAVPPAALESQEPEAPARDGGPQQAEEPEVPEEVTSSLDLQDCGRVEDWPDVPEEPQECLPSRGPWSEAMLEAPGALEAEETEDLALDARGGRGRASLLTWSAVLDRGEHSHLGMELLPSGTVLRVMHVSAQGAVGDFNAANPRAVIEPGDYITCINDISRDVWEMLNEAKRAGGLRLALCRTRTFRADVTKTGPLGAALGVFTSALVVQEVRAGALQNWNRSNREHRIEVGDHILEVNGAKDSPYAMLQALSEDGELSILVLPLHGAAP